MNEYAIEVKDLVKRYGDATALCGVTFSVPRGALFSYLGVNGAGKSTTIDILCSVLPKTSGEVRILGLDSRSHSAEIKRKNGRGVSVELSRRQADRQRQPDDTRGVLRLARTGLESAA